MKLKANDIYYVLIGAQLTKDLITFQKVPGNCHILIRVKPGAYAPVLMHTYNCSWVPGELYSKINSDVWHQY